MTPCTGDRAAMIFPASGGPGRRRTSAGDRVETDPYGPKRKRANVAYAQRHYG